VVRDPERLTALVFLGIRDRERFPLLFYRRDCADMALTAGTGWGTIRWRSREVT